MAAANNAARDAANAAAEVFEDQTGWEPEDWAANAAFEAAADAALGAVSLASSSQRSLGVFAAENAAESVKFERAEPGAEEAEHLAQANLLRDIFGNPFRPLPLRPVAIAPLAEQIYAGAWEKMPFLGEWLQEHGYQAEAEHCLDPNIHHVKGCWVVDWATGRE
jgi:hypothetical protein